MNKKEVEFQSGKKLNGTIFGEGSCGVILVPGASFELESWYPQAEQIANEGYLAFPIEFTTDDFGGNDTGMDILGAERFLHDEYDVNDIILIGASAGAYSALEANALSQPGTFNGTFLIAHPGGTEFVSDLDGPLEWIVAEDDDVVGSEDVKETFKQAKVPDEEKALTVLDGESHAQDLFDSEHSEELFEIMMNFIKENCA